VGSDHVSTRDIRSPQPEARSSLVAPIAEHTRSFLPALWLVAGVLLLSAAGLVAVARWPLGHGRDRMPDCGCN
jgi:hypothetical protein